MSAPGLSLTPLGFLNLLWPDKPAECEIQVWALQNRRSYSCQTTGRAARMVELCLASHMDVYTGVGLAPRDFGPHARCPADQIAGICGLWADQDLVSPFQTKKKLPATLEEARTVVPAEFPCTILNNSGYGLHWYWLFKEPWIFTDDEDRRRAHQLVYDWQTVLQFQSARRDWYMDRLADLARLLRVPGTYNYKQPEAPQAVTVIESDPGRRYNISDFREYLDELLRTARPDPKPAAPAPRSTPVNGEAAPVAVGFQLALDPAACIPDEVLTGWMEMDPRFARTWLRQRDDMPDQSASGYDLALANFGLEAGLTPQQIANLIIHWRREHGARPRTRMDYFWRTIERARSGAGRGETPAAADAAPEGAKNGAPPPAGHSFPGPPLAAGVEATPYAILSNVLGIPLERIVKITGQEPSYHLETPQGIIDLPHVTDLIEQPRLRTAIAKSPLHHLLPRFKPAEWDRLAQMMLNTAVDLPPDLESTQAGALTGWLEDYLRQVEFILTVEGQLPDSQRCPLVVRGQVAVNTRHLQHYLRAKGEKPSVQALASALKAIGATPCRLQSRRFTEQSRWLLPASLFPPGRFTDLIPVPEKETHDPREATP